LTTVITSPLLDIPGVRHAFFTRQGGVSTGIYDSLNVGQGSADAAEAVLENRRRAAARFDLPEGALNTCYQVHSAIAVEAREAWNGVRPEADGVVTARQGIACGALAADCAPILLADPAAGVVAAAHAGWKGALGGIAEATIARMTELGARPSQIIAVIGPCIGPGLLRGRPGIPRPLRRRRSRQRAVLRPGRGRKPTQLRPAPPSSCTACAGPASRPANGSAATPAQKRICSSPTAGAFKRSESDFGRLLSAIALD
jgi:hypothetical protein